MKIKENKIFYRLHDFKQIKNMLPFKNGLGINLMVLSYSTKQKFKNF